MRSFQNGSRKACKFGMKNQFDMNIVIAHPKDEKQKNALTAVLEAMEIKFEEEIPYNEAFVAKIKNGKRKYPIHSEMMISTFSPSFKGSSTSSIFPRMDANTLSPVNS
ncbi:MAG: hypothetical protein EAY68_02850, partial [Bacteroidetes bacterium]